MTVKELIEWLSNLPPDANVVAHCMTGNYVGPVKMVRSINDENEFYLTCDNPEDEDDD